MGRQHPLLTRRRQDQGRRRPRAPRRPRRPRHLRGDHRRPGAGGGRRDRSAGRPASSTSSTTPSFPTRCRRSSGGGWSSSRRRWRPPTTPSAALLDGETVDDNTILEILRTSDDSDLRRRAWEASKQIGAEVADRVRELARLRNEAAHSLGYRDHFALALDDRRDGRDAPVRHPRRGRPRRPARCSQTWKAGLDSALSTRFDCSPSDLRPWHLDDPFFQDPPVQGAVDLDPYFVDADLEALTMRTYDGLGLDLRAVLAAQRPVRALGQEPARVLHRHRPRGRRAGPVQRRDATSAGPRRCSTSSVTPSTTAISTATCPGSSARAAHALHHRRHRDVVRPPRPRPGMARPIVGLDAAHARRARAAAGPRPTRGAA